MNNRPKPGEDEDDLLRLQQEFLSSTSRAPAANIKHPEKRKNNGSDVYARDMVDPNVPPATSSLYSSKKIKFKEDMDETCDAGSQQNVQRDERETTEDLERRLDNRDTSMAAVLTSIIERDTRNDICMPPTLVSKGFPSVKAVDLDSKKSQPEGRRKKKSLFAQQAESQGSQHFGLDPSCSKPVHIPTRNVGKDVKSKSFAANSTRSYILEGGGLSATNKQAEVDQIHKENAERLATMAEAEILEEQRKLLETIDPKLVEFLRKKRAAATSNADAKPTSSSTPTTFSVKRETKKLEKQQERGSELPIEPSKEWLHMDTVEKDKLEWLKDLPPPPTARGAQTGRPARFDFEGNILPVDLDVPVNLGLHHHGDEPERAGYTLEEIFQLSRSSNQQQRTLALHTLARIISKAKSGELFNKIETDILPAILEGGVLMLLRWALDDSVLAVVAAAIDALHALLWSHLDEESLDQIWTWYQGNITCALTPHATLEKESKPEELDEENQAEESDADVARRDVVQALVLRMDMLVRFRFILDNMQPQAETVIKMLHILVRTAQHSAALGYEIVKCPGLLENIVKEFIPTVWKRQDETGPISCVYGIPVPSALKLMTTLCQCGRNLASSLVAKYNLNLILLRFLCVDAGEIHLPSKEATALQVEAYKLWRTCALYGLATQPYFDICSSITSTVGKLEDLWAESGLLDLHTHLLCVLETMLNVAGPPRSDQLDSPMDWSHVNMLGGPVLSCTQRVLTDIGQSYQIKKHDLHFPTACLNFLATFYIQEGQNGNDVITSLETLENFCSCSLEPLLSSYGFRIIVEQLCPCSNLLVASSQTKILPPSNLPSHGVYHMPEDTISTAMEVESEGNATQSSTESYESNMPCLSQKSPFGFLTAFLRLILTISKRHKAMMPKLIAPVVKDKDFFVYMKKTVTVSKPSSLCNSIFTRQENLLQHLWLKCCSLVPCEDMSVSHRVALNLLSRVGHGDEHLVHDLVSTVVFSQAFLSEGSELDTTSEALAGMSLNDVLHLKSATQEELNISRQQLLQDVYNSVAKIRGHYLMAFGGMEKAVLQSRAIFSGKAPEIQTQMFKCFGESLLPKDWTYLPLINIYNRALQSQQASGMSISPQGLAMVTSVLQWNYALEMWRPAEMNQISVTVRLSRILCAFIAGNDLFLEKPVHQYLAGLLRVLSSQKQLNRMEFEERIPGMTSFYDFFQEVLDHYEAVSFGDPVFGMFVLLPLQQRHNSLLRKAVWGERRKMLRTLRVSLKELLVPLEAFLEPEESDLELLQLQLTSLVSGAVQPEWSPLLYLVAVHHVNRFLFSTATSGSGLDSTPEEIVAARDRLWSHIISHSIKAQDVIMYKMANIDQPNGIELYSPLPPSRQATLDHYTAKYKC